LRDSSTVRLYEILVRLTYEIFVQLGWGCQAFRAGRTKITYSGAVAVLHHPDVEEIELVDVLAALGHPVRLAIARALASGEERFCGEIIPDVPKSSMTHHWRTLRESGVIRQRKSGRKLYLTLRREDLESRFPGLVDLVLNG
jgi:DNA-binding transcriptional ArsR family regulator